jgi:hypothetical protein
MRVLRDKLAASIASKEYGHAVFWVEQLEQREPGSPRWPHKRGDLLRLLHRDQRAFVAYATAVRLYSEIGKTNLATAMAKTALEAFPNTSALARQLDSETLNAFYAACPTPASMVLDSSDLMELSPAH